VAWLTRDFAALAQPGIGARRGQHGAPAAAPGRGRHGRGWAGAGGRGRGCPPRHGRRRRPGRPRGQRFGGWSLDRGMGRSRVSATCLIRWQMANAYRHAPEGRQRPAVGAILPAAYCGRRQRLRRERSERISFMTAHGPHCSDAYRTRMMWRRQVAASLVPRVAVPNLGVAHTSGRC
jgi:hypothetical protein